MEGKQWRKRNGMLGKERGKVIGRKKMEDNKRKERQKEEEMENSDSCQLFSAVFSTEHTTIVCPHSASCCQLTVTVFVRYINLFCNVCKMVAAFSDFG